MENYNQNNQQYTRMACTIYTLCNIIKYNFWIVVVDNFIIRLCKYFESINVWSPIQWAIFAIIYPAFIKNLNSKLWLNFRLVSWNINTLSNTDTNCWWVWMIHYHNWQQLIIDWVFSQDDVDQFNKYNWQTFEHNIWRDGSDWWYLINTDWWNPIKCSIDTLKYMVKTWILWGAIRTIQPADEMTTMVVALTKWMAKTDNMKLFLETNSSNPYLAKSQALFNFWKQ